VVDPAARLTDAETLRAALEAVAAELDGGGDAGRPPYRDLEAFGESDAGEFYGRQSESRRLEGMLERRPIVAVVGPSGAGKSSLVRAGVMPRLRRGGCVLLEMSPGRQPLSRLAERLTELTGEAVEADALASSAVRGGQKLRAYARSAGHRVLLFIDQFEEVYTLVEDPAARRAFCESLLFAGDDPQAPVRVVLAIREDFLPHLAGSPQLRERVYDGRFLLDPPARPALAQALEQPARRRGYTFEEGLLDEVLDALSGEATPLPALQVVASWLWAWRDEETLTLDRATLKRLGGVGGALSRRADQVLHGLSAEELESARRLLCALVTASGTRRQVGLEALISGAPAPDRARAMLRRLVEGRVLTTFVEGGASRVIFSHDALIHQWERLQGWLVEAQSERALAERIEAAAARWQAAGRPDGLLWRGAPLEAADRTLSGAVAMTDTATAFLQGARDQAERDARSRRTRRRLVYGVAIASFLVLVGFSLSLFNQLQRTETARQETLSALAVAEAEGLLSEASRLDLLDRPGEVLALRRAAAALGGGREGDEAALDDLVLDDLANRGASAHVFAGHEGAVRSVAFSSDGARLATGGEDGQVWLWAVATGEVQVLEGHQDAVLAVVTSPDGRWLASASHDLTARLWDWNTAAPGPVLEGHGGGVRALAFSPEGRLVATASEDGLGRIFDAATGALLHTLSGHNGGIWALAFSPDGAWLATGSDDNTARLWAVDGGLAGPNLMGHTDWVRALAFSPDGSQLITGSWDGTGRVWDPETGRIVHVLEGHEGYIAAIAVRPDGRYLATASSDHTARVWALKTGALASTLEGHEGPVRSLAFSEAHLATGGEDGPVRIWEPAAEPPRRRGGTPRRSSARVECARALQLRPHSGSPRQR